MERRPKVRLNYARMHEVCFDRDSQEELTADSPVISPLKVKPSEGATAKDSLSDFVPSAPSMTAESTSTLVDVLKLHVDTDDGIDGGETTADAGELTDTEEQDLAVELKQMTRAIKEAERLKKARKERMRKEIAEKKDQLKALKGKSVSKANKITLSELKQMKGLDEKVEEEMSKLGIGDYGDSTLPLGLSSAGLCSSEVGVKPKKFKSKKVVFESSSDSSDEPVADIKRKKKSGISAMSADKVRFPQVWPHSVLQNEYVSRSLKFHELNFSQFVAGELEILESHIIGEEERQGRLSFLKKIVYYSEIYEWKGLLELYAAWVRKIETGMRSWCQEPSEIEVPILTKYVKQVRQKTRRFGQGFSSGNASPGDRDSQSVEKESDKPGSLWFCPFYQRNKCVHKTHHFSVVRGQMRNCQHVCATCWQKDRKRMEHQECSTECPNH